MEQLQTGSPMTFMLAGHLLRIVVASSVSSHGEFICFRSPGFFGGAGDGRQGGGGAQLD